MSNVANFLQGEEFTPIEVFLLFCSHPGLDKWFPAPRISAIPPVPSSAFSIITAISTAIVA